MDPALTEDAFLALMVKQRGMIKNVIPTNASSLASAMRILTSAVGSGIHPS
jgi:hypothetical protein